MRDLYSKPVFISLLLFVLSFFLRLALISKGAFNSDCLSITLQAERLLDTHTFHYHFGFGYPLLIILAAFFVALGRAFSVADAVMSVNFMSVVFGSLCIPLFYHFTKTLLDKTTALLSAVLLSLCPIFISVSVFGIGHTPAMFFLFLGMLILIEFFKEDRLSLLLYSALTFGACGAVRIQDLVLFLPALTVFFFLYQPLVAKGKPMTFNVRLRFFLIFLSTCLLVIFLFHLPYLLAKTRSAYVEQLNQFTEISISNRFNMEQIRRGFIVNIMYLIQTLSILGVMLSLVGFILLARERLFVFIFILGWILVPFYLFCNLQSIVPRHQILILPPFVIAQCYVLARLLPYKLVFRLTSLSIYVVILLLSFWHYLPHFVFRHRHSLITEYSQWLGTMTEPDAQIIATDIGGFVERYAHRKSLGRMLHARYQLSDDQLTNYKQELEGLLDQGTPVYITDTGLYVYDRRKKFSNFIKDNFKLEYVGTMIYEDWHRDYLQFTVFNNPLYRIRKK